MRTIREFLDNKYSKKEIGKENFDETVAMISKYVLEKHTAPDGLDDSIVERLRVVAQDRTALDIEGSLGVVSLGAGVIGGSATAVGSEDTMLQALGIAGATTAGIMLIGYIKDRIRYNESKARLKNWVQYEIKGADIVIPEMSERTEGACIGEVCETLVDDFIMEMK